MLRGYYLTFAEGIDLAANAQMQVLSRRLLAHLPLGVSDIIPSYSRLFIEYDDRLISQNSLKQWLEAHSSQETGSEIAREVRIPVIYDGEDLADISQRTGLSQAEVIRKHSQRSYYVYALGFTPGFPFMAEVDEALQLPRKAIPRATVAANTVAMTDGQTGIYPLRSPGGWNLLGRTQIAVFDPHRQEPFLVQAGDRVRFIARQGEAAAEPSRLELLPKEPKHPVLKVHKPGLLDLVLDKGRFMAGRFGLARSGPVDSPLARLANQLVANEETAAVLELTLSGPILECLATTVLALAGQAMLPVVNDQELASFTSFLVKKGDILRFRPNHQGVRSYLAVAGGIEAKMFMGSCSVDLKGYIGRALKAGDSLGQAKPHKPLAARQFRPYQQEQDPKCLRIYAGPQAEPELLAELMASSYTVLTADRMGIRLSGKLSAGRGILSEAVPIGAIQVSSGGMPMILLNDRGTLGGYAKPAIVHPHDLAKAAQLRQGDTLRFSLMTKR